MTGPQFGAGRRRLLDVSAAAGTGLLAALAMLALTVRPDDPGPAVQAVTVDRSAGVAMSGAEDTRPPGPQPLPYSARARPLELAIPAIAVRTPLVPLGVNSRDVLQPPADFRRAGWFAAGPVPGDRGPAVIAGHLDSFSGAAVFALLRTVHRGDLVVVTRSDGRTVRFRVTATVTVAKTAFPTAQVYGPTPVPTLRLITCGGHYDHARRAYPDDVIVYAELAS